MAHIKTSFYLTQSKTNRKGKAPVYVRIKFKNQIPVNLSMGIQLIPDWDNRKLKVKPKNKQAHAFNIQMTSIQLKTSV